MCNLWKLLWSIATSTLCRKLFVQILDHEVGTVVFLGQRGFKIFKKLDNLSCSSCCYFDLIAANSVGKFQTKLKQWFDVVYYVFSLLVHIFLVLLQWAYPHRTNKQERMVPYSAFQIGQRHLPLVPEHSCNGHMLDPTWDVSIYGWHPRFANGFVLLS